MHLAVDTDREETQSLSVEISLKPVELLYRARTFSNFSSAVEKLGGSQSPKRQSALDDPSDKASKIVVVRSALCSVSSIRVSAPVTTKDDTSPLFKRCAHYADGCSLARPAVGFVLHNLSLEHKKSDEVTPDEKKSDGSMPTTSLEIHSFFVFASSPDDTSATMRRQTRVVDICAATGRLEVDPFIPIAIAYKKNMHGNGTCVAKDTFPSVPAFSSFKARQEDEDDDDAIDRVLSEKLGNVSINSRRALRAQDPQGRMLLEVEKCDAVLMVHIPEVVVDVTKEELCMFLGMVNCVLPQKSSSGVGESRSTGTSLVAVSVACDSVSFALVGDQEDQRRGGRDSQLLKLDKCRAYSVLGGVSGGVHRFLSHEMTFYEGKSCMVQSAMEDKSDC